MKNTDYVEIVDRERAATETGTEKDWLVMIYLSGDNDLSEETVWSLLEILRAKPNEKVGVVVQIDPKLDGIRRFDVSGLLRKRSKEDRKQEATERIHHRELSTTKHARLGDNMASKSTLEHFIRDSMSQHRAKKSLLILSGHGGGPTGTSFLIDQFPSRGLSLADVAAAIRDGCPKGKEIDVIGVDSCGMAMAEVGNELKGSAKVLVASEGFELNTGWPYFHILAALNGEVGMDAEQLGSRIVKIHTEYYSNYLMSGVSTDISACNLEKANALADGIKVLAKEMTRLLLLPYKYSRTADDSRDKRIFAEDLPIDQRADIDAIVLAHWRAQSYRFERHTDLYDFCELLERGCHDPELRAACSRLKTIIEGDRTEDGSTTGYIIASAHSGGSFQHSHGVAVFFPWAKVDKEYSELGLAAATGWDVFLKHYVRTTRRRARGEAVDIDPSMQDRQILEAIRDFPNLDTRDFPELGTRDFPELNTRDLPLSGFKDFPELGTKDFPELGTKGKVLMPVMKNPPDIFFKEE